MGSQKRGMRKMEEMKEILRLESWVYIYSALFHIQDAFEYPFRYRTFKWKCIAQIHVLNQFLSPCCLL